MSAQWGSYRIEIARASATAFARQSRCSLYLSNMQKANHSASDVHSVDAATMNADPETFDKTAADKEAREIGPASSTDVADKEAARPPPAFTVPDGGWEAWSVVVGGWFALFSTFVRSDAPCSTTMGRQFFAFARAT
jgi:hypothetical protein